MQWWNMAVATGSSSERTPRSRSIQGHGDSVAPRGLASTTSLERTAVRPITPACEINLLWSAGFSVCWHPVDEEELPPTEYLKVGFSLSGFRCSTSLERSLLHFSKVSCPVILIGAPLNGMSTCHLQLTLWTCSRADLSSATPTESGLSSCTAGATPARGWDPIPVRLRTPVTNLNFVSHAPDFMSFLVASAKFLALVAIVLSLEFFHLSAAQSWMPVRDWKSKANSVHVVPLGPSGRVSLPSQ